MNCISQEEFERRRVKGEVNSKAFLAMESDVFNIARMAAVTALVLDVYMDEKREAAERPFTAAELAEHLEPWSNAVDFMVHHLHDAALLLRRHYS